ncbi:MAG: GNAT family N-acetyltransferase [Microthrixaceae bacterium]
MTPAVHADVEIRPLTPDDTDAVLELLHVCLGWSTDDRFRQYFQWKHHSSPLGPSPAWVATEGRRLVGFRSFVPWELESGTRARVTAARAVDVATLPAARGRGVFADLTSHALAELRAAGTQLVFTTPNEAAGRGWARAGARSIGRLPIWVRPRSPRAALRLLRARTAADRWPAPTRIGTPATLVLDDPRAATLLAALPHATAPRTRRTIELLRWRYGFTPLGYRAVTLGEDPSEGFAIMRLRRRGGSTEATLCEVLLPGKDPSGRRELVRRVARAEGADYVLGARSAPAGGPPLGVPRRGPAVLALALDPGALDDSFTGHWDLGLGDVELL